MKVEIDHEELQDACHKLSLLNEDLSYLIDELSKEINLNDHMWSGKSAKAYKEKLEDLLIEHRKMIKFYDKLSEDILTMGEELEDYSSSLNIKIRNI